MKLSDFKAMWGKYAKVHAPLMYRDMLSVLNQLEEENETLRMRENRHMNQRDRLRERIWQLIRIGYEERAKRYLAESKSAMLEGGEG